MSVKNHNWTKETMGECAKIHMDQLLNCYFNYADSKEKQKKIKEILLSYFEIEKSLKSKR